MPLARPAQAGGGHQHLIHLPAVGAGVHVYRAAHRAGDAEGEFQAGERLVPGILAQAFKRHAGGALDGAAVGLKGGGGLPAVQTDHRAAKAFVPYQQIGAVAQQVNGNILLPAAVGAVIYTSAGPPILNDV